MSEPVGRGAGPFKRWWKSPGVRGVRRRLSDLQVLLYPVLGAGTRVWVWLVHRRVDYDRRGALWDYIRDGSPCIIALWHQDVCPLMMELFRYTPTRYGCLFMVSPGRIGRMGTYFLNQWGIECIAGSSAGGGVEAVERLGRAARQTRRSVLLMADRSRGPAREAAWGPIYLARDTGFPIIAVRAWGDNLVMLKNTWMQLVLPKPWGRAVFLSSDALHVPPTEDKETLDKFRRELERRLNELCDATDAYFAEGPHAVDRWGPRISDTRLVRRTS